MTESNKNLKESQNQLIDEKCETKSFLKHIVACLPTDLCISIFLNNGIRLYGKVLKITNDTLLLSNTEEDSNNQTKGIFNQLVFFSSIATISF